MFAASQFHKALIIAAFSSLSLSALAAPVAIGYQAPLTGEYAQYGNQFRNAANLALDEYNQTHKAAPVVIKFADSKGDALEGVSIAHKFSDDNSIVGVIGDFSSTVSIAAGKVYAETIWLSCRKPPRIRISSRSAPGNSAISSPRHSKGRITPAGSARTISGKWPSSASRTTGGQTASKNFAKSFKDAGGEVTALESFNRVPAIFAPS
jgi:branched-chain amino acid transport system substrate-binding protein